MDNVCIGSIREVDRKCKTDVRQGSLGAGICLRVNKRKCDRKSHARKSHCDVNHARFNQV